MYNFFQYLFNRYLWSTCHVMTSYFYRFNWKKHTSGLERIPRDKPVLFCTNHPNSFMDALVLASHLPRRTWFLARSDVFRGKMANKFLRFTQLLPIYRLQEGVENLSKNDKTFDACSEILLDKRAIIIFSEGLCIQERRLRKLKKGTARIAFGTEVKNDFKLDLMIVPVGINYAADAWKFRTPVFMQFGEPFAVSNYEELFNSDKARAINQFTRDLEERMKSLLIIIEDPANDQLVAQLEEVLTRKWAAEEYRDPKNAKDIFHISKEITHFVNQATRREPERISALREKTSAYFKKQKATGVRDWVVEAAAQNKLSPGKIFGNFLFFLLTFPLWLFGLITNYVPYKLPYNIAQKKVKSIEWHASVTGASALLIYQVYWLLQSLAVALIFRNWYVLFEFMALVPLSGMFAQWYWTRIKKTRGMLRWKKLQKEQPALANEMLQLRSEIEKEADQLHEAHRLVSVEG